MARARTIKPRFMRSRSMRKVSYMARLNAHPLVLARGLYPGDAEAAGLLPGWLDELERQHCIERYTVDRLEYLRIVNWHRHQKIYHPTPNRLPARPAGFQKESGEIQETLGSRGEKPSGDKPLTSPAQIPERFPTRPETLGKNPASPCVPGTLPAFTSDSGGERFFRRATGAVRLAWARSAPPFRPAGSPRHLDGRLFLGQDLRREETST